MLLTSNRLWINTEEVVIFYPAHIRPQLESSFDYTAIKTRYPTGQSQNQLKTDKKIPRLKQYQGKYTKYIQPRKEKSGER